MKEDLRIETWLKQVRFKKRLFGGVSEQDVWKKIGELHALYRDALRAERVRCDALIEAIGRTADEFSSDEMPPVAERNGDTFA